MNDNAYEIDLLEDCQVSATFNVCDLSPYEYDIDSKMIHTKEKGDDEIWSDNNDVIYKGPVTRTQARKLQDDV